MKYNYLPIKLPFRALVLVFLTYSIQAQNDYSVSPIPYQIYTATSPVQGTFDDTFSAPIPLGFDFYFYGGMYNQVNVSTNGYISFNPQPQGTTSPWAFSTAIPNADFPVKNAFLGCYHDLNNANAEGTITYAVIGSAPYRRLVVLFDNQSHFSCTALKSTFQMILYETLNVLDVQLIDKDVCASWNNGNAVTGIIDASGLMAYTPVGRNTGPWTAFHEGWRFKQPINLSSYLFAKCDDDADGYVSFNLQVAQNDLSSADPLLVSFYESESDAISQTNALSNLIYTNTTANMQTIYANINGEVKSVVLRVIACTNDYDMDTVATSDEDLNADTNLANDDTDLDGIPNFIDNDDDGDLVLTTVEYVFARSASSDISLLDSDNDGLPNYIDADDDGDGILTILEDYNSNYNPADDDVNANSIPDYLENTGGLGINNSSFRKDVTIYPNPASSILNIENKSNEAIAALTIYNVNGAMVKEVKTSAAVPSIAIADLQSGIYFVKIQLTSKVINYKFIKN